MRRGNGLTGAVRSDHDAAIVWRVERASPARGRAWPPLAAPASVSDLIRWYASPAPESQHAMDPSFTPSSSVPRPSIDELLRLARMRPELAWAPGTHISTARNAHFTNRRIDLASALRSDCTSLEGDVCLVGETAVLAHDRSGAVELTFAEWASIVAASGRMMRVDLKDAAALDAVLANLDDLGVPDERVTINMTVARDTAKETGGHGTAVSLSAARGLRSGHPKMFVGLNVVESSEPAIRDLAGIAAAIGRPVMVALEHRSVTPELLALIQPAAIVGVWGDPPTRPVPNRDRVVDRLRSLGVDGMIDLRGDTHA